MNDANSQVGSSESPPIFPNDLAGLTAIVTGGASGIGLATAEMLRDRGARVVAFDLSDVLPDGVTGLKVDIGDDDQVQRAVDATVARFGGVDVLVNNAGIGAQGSVADNHLDEWRRVFDINVLGVVRVTKAALPHLRRSAHASVVNVCSIAATAGLPQRALYSASKGAVLSLTLAMAADHIREGIRVNAVNPGTADTPWVARLLDSADNPEAERQALNARQPHGRLITPEEIAAAIVYLASPAAASTIGVILPVDGGLSGLRLRPIQR